MMNINDYDYNYDADCDEDYENDNYEYYDCDYDYYDHYNDYDKFYDYELINYHKQPHKHHYNHLLFTEGIYFDEEDITSDLFNPNCCRNLYLDLANGVFG